MGVRVIEFVVLCVYLPEGADVPDVVALKEVLDASEADHWQFIQPGTFIVYFRKARKGAESADKVKKKISDLKRARPELREMRTGIAEGGLMVEFSWLGFGRGKLVPFLGDVVIQAQNNAKEVK